MVRWFGCFGKSREKEGKASKKGVNGGPSNDVDAAAAGAHGHNHRHDAAAQDGVRSDGEVLREKVSSVEHPSSANNLTSREREKATARKFVGVW